MTRTDVFNLAKNNGLDVLMTQAGRVTTDTSGGYAPAIDRALAVYRVGRPDAVLSGDTVVLDADATCFEIVLRATVYDVVLPSLALQVDTAVDAPLTNAKFSQAYRSIKELRDAAWLNAASCGFGMGGNTGGFKVNLDYLEPSPSNTEYA